MFGVSQAIELIGNIVNKAIPDPLQKAQAEALLEQVRQQPDIVQAEVNRIEAANPKVFVAGWRPFIGWCCGAAFVVGLFAKIIMPMIIIFVSLFIHDVSILARINTAVSQLKQLDIQYYLSVVTGMLGLAGLRTYEKKQGVARN